MKKIERISKGMPKERFIGVPVQGIPAFGPLLSEVPCLSGTLRRSDWQLPNFDFSYLEGNFSQIGELPWVPDLTMNLVFVLQGELQITAKEGGQYKIVPEQTHNALQVHARANNWGVNTLTLRAFIVGIAPAQALALASKGSGIWGNFALHIAQNLSASLLPAPSYLDLRLQSCLQDLLQCTLPAAHQPLYFEAKAMELMALQAACYQETQLTAPRHAKTEYDRERILFAKDYLLKHIAMPPTLAKLALVSGINEFKLKNGFREMFGNSVFAYLAEHRLEIAKRELIDGKKTATEIAFELGYSSLQHFSSRFKERYGVTPTALRRK
jgi:AraC family transcriptional regulator, transcriptional activator of the genes for pyochelin and ferripyochelin receptors